MSTQYQATFKLLVMYKTGLCARKTPLCIVLYTYWHRINKKYK